MTNPLKKKIFENQIETAILNHNDEIARYISSENKPDSEYLLRMSDALNSTIKTIVNNYQVNLS